MKYLQLDDVMQPTIKAIKQMLFVVLTTILFQRDGRFPVPVPFD